MQRSWEVEGFGYLEKLKLLQKLHKLCEDDYWRAQALPPSTSRHCTLGCKGERTVMPFCGQFHTDSQKRNAKEVSAQGTTQQLKQPRKQGILIHKVQTRGRSQEGPKHWRILWCRSGSTPEESQCAFQRDRVVLAKGGWVRCCL